jgi:hypothetical protein
MRRLNSRRLPTIEAKRLYFLEQFTRLAQMRMHTRPEFAHLARVAAMNQPVLIAFGCAAFVMLRCHLWTCSDRIHPPVWRGHRPAPDSQAGG